MPSSGFHLHAAEGVQSAKQNRLPVSDNSLSGLGRMCSSGQEADSLEIPPLTIENKLPATGVTQVLYRCYTGVTQV